MAVIGNFTSKDGKYTGTIRTMTINVKAQIVPNENSATGAPSHRIFAGGAELGAAWEETSESGGRPYLSVKLDDPNFDKPVRAAFFIDADEETGILVWTRSKPQKTSMMAAE